MRRPKRKFAIASGVGQLTLVEHALCPLDSRSSLAANLAYQTSFDYSDKKRRRRSGSVRVFCPLGLSAHDELLLWGCLALTLADPQSEGQLCATRHYILRKLGLIDARSRRGGRQYDDFSESLQRLSTVRYLNDSFYDPVRAEHRKVSFGFFSYSLPIAVDSPRACRIVWDPVFFEFVTAASGALRFDLAIYRELDPATRRLFLFLTKLFARNDQTHPLDLAAVAINVLGFSQSLRPSDQKAKVSRCIRKLIEHGVVDHSTQLFRKMSVGVYRIVLRKGPAYGKLRKVKEHIESPLVEPLTDIGFDEPTISRVLKRFQHNMLREWVDITLAARERFGMTFFRRSPAAFLMDNLKSASTGTRTPPDWWLDIRKSEERALADHARNCSRRSPTRDQLPTRAFESVDDVSQAIFQQFRSAGQSESVAKDNLKRLRDVQRNQAKDC